MEFSKFFNIFAILAYELHNKILILEKFDNFFFSTFKKKNLENVDNSQWQVHLRRSNIYSMFCYMFLTHKKHQKTQFLSDFVIFRNTWLFSEIFGYFLTHRYQIWIFWLKMWILQMILDYRDILNTSLGELGIKNAVLVL